MKKLLPLNYWTVSRHGDTLALGIFSENNAIYWEAVSASDLPQNLIGVVDGELRWLLSDRVDGSSVGHEVAHTASANRVNSVKSSGVLLRFLAGNNGVFGAVVRHTIESCVLRPSTWVCRWCHSVLNSSTNVPVLLRERK